MENVENDNSKGAPYPSIKEAVLRLYHLGWKIEEIARNLKISKGEVELFLAISDIDVPE